MRGLVIALGVLAVLPAAGCSTIGEAVSSYNPFREKEKPLPGERKQILAASDPLDEYKGQARPVRIAAARAFPDWSQPGGNAANDPGHVALSGGAGWRAKAGQVGRRNTVQVTAAPLVYQGRVYVYDPNGNVSAHSLTSGGRLWQVALKPEDERNPTAGGGIAAADGRIYAATGYRKVVALDAGSGRIIWSTDIEDPARGAPTVAGGRVYFVSANEKVYALNAADGEEVWSFRGIPEPAGVLSNASPAVSGSTLVVPYSSGEIVAYDTTSGKMKWLDTVVRGARTSALAGLNDVAARPVISGGLVFATGISGRTLAVRARNGDRVWEANVGSAYTPVISGEAVFMTDTRGRLVALSRSSGAVMWVTQLPIEKKRKRREIWTGPVLAGGTLWVASSRGRLIAADPANGTIRSTRNLGGSFYASPIAASGRLLVLAGNGSLIAAN